MSVKVFVPEPKEKSYEPNREFDEMLKNLGNGNKIEPTKESHVHVNIDTPVISHVMPDVSLAKDAMTKSEMLKEGVMRAYPAPEHIQSKEESQLNSSAMFGFSDPIMDSLFDSVKEEMNQERRTMLDKDIDESVEEKAPAYIGKAHLDAIKEAVNKYYDEQPKTENTAKASGISIGFKDSSVPAQHSDSFEKQKAEAERTTSDFNKELGRQKEAPAAEKVN